MTDESPTRKEGRKVEKVASLKRTEGTKYPTTLDNICKEVILRNKIFRRNWPKRYEYLTGEFFQKVLREECKKAGIPENSFDSKSPEDKTQYSPIPIKPSLTIPKTTAGTVGFRSSRAECNLEFTGRMYMSPKWTIEPPTEPGEFRVTQQRHIFLG